jgi:hypothetical protein
MLQKCTTSTEAERVAFEMDADFQMGKLCPAMLCKCLRGKCVSFQPAEITPGLFVKSPACMNSMVTGVVTFKKG